LEQRTYSQIDYTLTNMKTIIQEESQQFNLSWYGVEEFIYILKEVGYQSIQTIINYDNKRMLNLKTITFIAK
jgi:hypothetical protein